MIAAPPLETGAVHETTDEPVTFTDETTVAETPDGATGGPIGVTEPEATDATPVPAKFVAVTVNEYATPLMRPATVHDVAAVEQVNEPGLDVTV